MKPEKIILVPCIMGNRCIQVISNWNKYPRKRSQKRAHVCKKDGMEFCPSWRGIDVERWLIDLIRWSGCLSKILQRCGRGVRFYNASLESDMGLSCEQLRKEWGRLIKCYPGKFVWIPFPDKVGPLHFPGAWPGHGQDKASQGLGKQRIGRCLKDSVEGQIWN